MQFADSLVVQPPARPHGSTLLVILFGFCFGVPHDRDVAAGTGHVCRLAEFEKQLKLLVDGLKLIVQSGSDLSALSR